MSVTLDTVEVVRGGDPQFAIVWLHGLGADGHDFEPIVPALDLIAGVRFVFPHAPVRPVTINRGMRMRAWYDIRALDRRATEDEGGIRDSSEAVSALVDRQLAAGTDPERVVLAGFSQGGAVALHAGLRYPRPLCGIVALSAYLPLRASLAAERAEANVSTPIFMGHGSFDPVLPQALGLESLRVLEQHGYAVEWHSYPMAHRVSAEEIADISRWLNARFAAARS